MQEFFFAQPDTGLVYFGASDRVACGDTFVGCGNGPRAAARPAHTAAGKRAGLSSASRAGGGAVDGAVDDAVDDAESDAELLRCAPPGQLGQVWAFGCVLGEEQLAGLHGTTRHQYALAAAEAEGGY